MAGGLSAATDYMAEHGTIDGSTDAVLEGASTGFAGGTFTGAATGTLRGASDFTRNPGKYCFVAGTLILTTVGLMNIEDIRVGDYVYAENTETGETSYQSVLETYINQTEELYTITIDGEEIKATPGHPFYTSEEGWISAKDLEVGDKVTTADGEEATVEEVKKEDLEESVNVYNFNVMDYHTYYVGENSILVHNANGKSCSIATDTVDEAKDSLKKAVDKGDTSSKTYQTYTKTNPVTGEVYSGRTSGTGSPIDNVAKRDANHHMNSRGFGPAMLDKTSDSYQAIRGREQMLIEYYGGAKSMGGISGNAINGIGTNNKNKDIYINAAKGVFGNLE